MINFDADKDFDYWLLPVQWPHGFRKHTFLGGVSKATLRIDLLSQTDALVGEYTWHYRYGPLQSQGS